MIEIKHPEQPLFIMLVGVAASGKSMFANEHLLPWLRSQGREAVVISKDKRRNEATVDQGITFEQFQQSRENITEIETALKNEILEAAQAKKDIILDRVNSTVKYRRVTMESVPDTYRKIAIIFEPRDLGLLFMRSLGRDSAKIKEGKVPYLIPVRSIKQKLDKLQLPTRSEGFDEILTVSFEQDSSLETPAPTPKRQNPEDLSR